MRKQGTRPYFGAKKTKEKKQRAPPPSIERGTSPLAHCPALHKGRASFLGAWRSILARPGLEHSASSSTHGQQNLAHQENSALPSTRAG
ncbi:hypothetical protein AHAS_Ahas05G0149000 [Arachis hypogaea]